MSCFDKSAIRLCLLVPARESQKVKGIRQSHAIATNSTLARVRAINNK